MTFIADPITFITNWLTQLMMRWGWSTTLIQVLLNILGSGILVMGAMVFTTVLIWAERKLGARFQDRPGPNRVGPWGIFQTIADMLKIFTKEYITPVGADKIPYNLAPVLAVAAVLCVWAVLPFSSTVFGTNIGVGLLFIIAVGGLGEIAIILAGFGSNNKYALLGAFRAVAQLVSYEVPMVIVLLIPVMLSGSMGMNDIVAAQSVPFIILAPIAGVIFFTTLIAENGRAPFDLVEADSELVAGYNIEYSGLKFGFFFVADFLHAFTSALIFSTVFLGGWQGPGVENAPILGFVYLLIKTLLVYFIMLTLRFSLPRFRIDQMMNLNWKILTPLALFTFMVTALVNKLLPPGNNLIRIGGLLAVNLLLWFITNWALSRFITNQPRPVVTGVRPVAIGEKKTVVKEEPSA
jgi:NADH-quinone oxidoreductase subunit H